MNKLVFFLVSFLCAGNAAYGADIAAARQALKNYGLAHCIADQFPDKSAMRDDMGGAIGLYGFMGKGLHDILQDEDTLETRHNPYVATADYIASVYSGVPASSKYANKKVVFYACLDIYNAEAFDRFISTQDKYIRP